MQRHDRSELLRFLRAVDAHLNRREDVVIFGGAAAALAYHSRRVTSDIDTRSRVSDALARAAEAARKATGLQIPIQAAPVYDAPYNYESRLVPFNAGFGQLRIRVPERHDLALMKVVRGYEHDLEAVEDMHREEALNLNLLVTRFEGEMKHVIKSGSDVKLSFLAMLARLYGERVAHDVDQQLANWDTV